MTRFAENKKAFFDYEVLEKFEAGIELLGLETKSVKKGQSSLDGTHIIIRGREAYILGLKIPPFQTNNTPKNYDPEAIRRLLLTKKEIRILEERTKNNGLTIIPISMYNKGNKVKVEIGLVRGKKKYDKRESIKKREVDRNIRRTLKEK